VQQLKKKLVGKTRCRRARW